MQRYERVLFILVLTFIVACGPATPVGGPDGPAQAEPDTAPEGSPGTGDQDVFPRVTVTPASETEPYPPPPTPIPTPEGYPAPADAPPTVAPYPGGYPVESGTIWIIRPSGEQCAEPEQIEYADLQEATTALTAADIPVIEAETTELIVCAACGCPTSTHFRVQINAVDWPRAEALGWQREE